MKQRDKTAASKPEALVRAQDAFTAEGAPPPGLVATAVPATPAAGAAVKKTARGPARAPGTRNGPVPRRVYPR